MPPTTTTSLPSSCQQPAQTNKPRLNPALATSRHAQDLSRWRMQLASRMLQTTNKTVLQIGLAVGYESEAAFVRAFKRELGVPPARYRKSLAQERCATSS